MSEHLPVLHQQKAMTVRAFAEQQGISIERVFYYIKSGRLIGAQQDSRSKKWWVYPPARLMVSEIRKYKPREVEDVKAVQVVQKLAKAPDVFTSRKVKEIDRSLGLSGSKQIFHVVLTGAQIFMVERALLRESEAAKERLEDCEFDLVKRVLIGNELSALFRVVHLLKDVVKGNGKEAQS